ncbi:PH domain-containing protein [Nocardia otitidiscaviarum]|nr:PH domain-containing protein [Nocardia otitidiscaviarum]
MPVVRIWRRGGEEPPRRPEREDRSATGEPAAASRRGSEAATDGSAPDTESPGPETAPPAPDAAPPAPDAASAGSGATSPADAASAGPGAAPSESESGSVSPRSETSSEESAPVPTTSDIAAPAAADSEWDLEVRPRRSTRNARIVAAVLVVVFGVAGVSLRNGSTGVNFRVVDQVAVVAIGLLLGGGVLLLTRPRLRVGARGVVVRNIVGDSEFRWQDIRGVSFPDKKAWPRLELVDDDYVPILAIRANDGERAVAAMDRFRELGAKYSAAPPA